MTAPHAVAVPEDLPKLVIAVETTTVTEIVALVGRAITPACVSPTTPEQAEQGRAVLIDIQKLKNLIEKNRKAAQAPFKHINDQIMEAAKGALQPLEQAQSLVKSGIEAFIQATIAANAAQQQAIAHAQMQPAPEGRQTPTLAVITPQARPAAVSTYEAWEVEITDETLIPRMYLMPNTSAIHEACKMGAVIPGVSAKKVTRVAAR